MRWVLPLTAGGHAMVRLVYYVRLITLGEGRVILYFCLTNTSVLLYPKWVDYSEKGSPPFVLGKRIIENVL